MRWIACAIALSATHLSEAHLRIGADAALDKHAAAVANALEAATARLNARTRTWARAPQRSSFIEQFLSDVRAVHRAFRAAKKLQKDDAGPTMAEVGAAGDKLLEAKTAANQALSEAAQVWNTEYSKVSQEITNSMNKIELLSEQHNVALHNMIEQVTEKIKAAEDPLPAMPKQMEIAFDSHMDFLERRQKEWEKALKDQQESWTAGLERENSATNRMFMEAQKESEEIREKTTGDMNDVKADAAKFDEKQRARMDETRDKFNEQMSNEADKLHEEKTRATAIGSRIERFSEKVDADLANLDTTGLNGNPGLEKAAEHAEHQMESWDDTMKARLELILQAAMEKLGANAKGLEDMLGDTQGDLLEASSRTEGTIGEFAKSLMRTLGENERNMKKAQETAEKDEGEMKGWADKLGEQLEQSTQQLLTNTQQTTEERAELKQQMTEMIAQFTEKARDKYAEAADGATNELEKKLAKSENEATKGFDGITSDVEEATGQVSEEAEAEISEVQKTLGKFQSEYQHVEDNSRRAIDDTHQTANRLKQIEAEVPNMDDIATRAYEAAKHAVSQAKDQDQQMLEENQREKYAALQEIAQQLSGFRAAGRDLQQDVGGSVNQAVETNDKDIMAIMSSVKSYMAAVRSKMKTAAGDFQEGFMKLHETEGELHRITEDTKQEESDGFARLADLRTLIPEKQAELTSAISSMFADTNAASMDRVVKLKDELNMYVAAHEGKLSEIQNSLGKVMNDATEVNTMQHAELNEAINKEVIELAHSGSKLDRMSKQMLPDHTERMHALQATKEKLAGFGREMDENRADVKVKYSNEANELGSAMRADADKQVTKMTDRVAADTQRASDDIAKDRLAMQKEAEAARHNEEAAVATAAGAYEAIQAAIVALGQKEANMNADQDLARAKQAVETLTAAEAKRQEDYNGLNVKLASTKADAVKDMDALETERNAARTAIQKLISGSNERLTQEEEKIVLALNEAMEHTAASVDATANDVVKRQGDLQAAIRSAAERILEESGEGSKTVEEALNRVHEVGHEVKAALQKDDSEQQQEATNEKGRSDGVGRDITSVGTSVNNEVNEMEVFIRKLEAELDPSAELAKSQETIKALRTMIEEGQDEASRRATGAQSANHALTSRIQGMIDDLEKDAMLTQQEIEQHEAGRGSELAEVKQEVGAQISELKELANDGLELSEELHGAHQRRFDQVFSKLAFTKDQLTKMLALQKHQSAEALQDVMDVLVKAGEVDAAAGVKRDGLVKDTDAWRKQTQDVFAQMGLDLDLERVEQEAALMLAAEEATGGAASDVKEKMMAMLRSASQATLAEIDKVHAEAQRLIDEIMANENLSQAEKERRIREIREASGRKVYELLAGAHKLEASQQHAELDIDIEMKNLNDLLQRAQLILQSGDIHSDEAKRLVSQLVSECKAKISDLRERYVTAYSLVEQSPTAASLLETGGQWSVESWKEGGVAALRKATQQLSVLGDVRKPVDRAWESVLAQLEEVTGAATRAATLENQLPLTAP